MFGSQARSGPGVAATLVSPPGGAGTVRRGGDEEEGQLLWVQSVATFSFPLLFSVSDGSLQTEPNRSGDGLERDRRHQEQQRVRLQYGGPGSGSWGGGTAGLEEAMRRSRSD